MRNFNLYWVSRSQVEIYQLSKSWKGYLLASLLSILGAFTPLYLSLAWGQIHKDGPIEQTIKAPICSAWIPAQKSFSAVGIDRPEEAEENCPEGEALFSVMLPRGVPRSGDKIQIHGNCCPLPVGVFVDDSEPSKHVFVEQDCPDGYIATGAKQQLDDLPSWELDAPRRDRRHWTNRRTQYLRCTKLNLENVSLGARVKSVQVGWVRDFRTMFMDRILRQDLPITLRVGLGRVDKYSWSDEFCIGKPWGVVLTGKSSKYCRDMRFQPLIFRAQDGASSAIKESLDYSYCLSVSSKFSSDIFCSLEK